MTTAIVIACYNRPIALKRLLSSISKASYPNLRNIPLIISIDYGGAQEVVSIAEDFEWLFGKKEIIWHKANLGLKDHIIQCGDLTSKYDSIIMLEDDIFVSPYFYEYALQAAETFSECEQVGGISLYSYFFNEFTGLPFYPIQDGYDNYFVQTTSSWGQLWTNKQWKEFRAWLMEYDNSIYLQELHMPKQTKEWPETSWKKYFNAFLVDTDRYFIFPNISLTTNFGDIGTHFQNNTNQMQSSCLAGSKEFRFSTLEKTMSIYDSFFEIKPKILKKLNQALVDYDFETDLYGNKSQNIDSAKKTLFLSINDVEKEIFSYGCGLIPQELNIAWNIPGDFFKLGYISEPKSLPKKKEMMQLFNLSKQAKFGKKEYLFSKTCLGAIKKQLIKLRDCYR